MKKNRRNLSWAIALLLTAHFGCATDAEEPDGTVGSDAVDDPVLVDSAIIFDGAPANDSLPSIGKADQQLPEKFTEVSRLQSPVKSQGSRGVCSIFSTTAYMEHLYIAEGTITDPDFSEQYLQWSVKFEVDSFPNSSGSNAFFNLRAISEFGIPEESAWPYETAQWGASNDPECEGKEDLPTKCYTNGEPPDAARQADKFHLPPASFISTRSRDIKSHIFNKNQGVVVGLTFFYQSWNHRRSQLPRNMDYWGEGYVLYPNDKDKEISLEKRAGHSILLVGWDDNLEVPIRDENGDVVTDADGEPLTERGFFLFKNSWGTGGFGTKNPHGDGFGWISYRYVQEFGSGRVSDLPRLDVAGEVCGDGVDNDNDNLADCADAACADDPVCTTGSSTFEAIVPTDGLTIPDNDPDGVEVPIEIPVGNELQAINLTLNVTHSFRGDLSVRLVHPDGSVAQLLQNGFDSGADLDRTFVVDDFVGKDSGGTYRVIVADHAAVDTGVVNAASLDVVR